MSTTGPRLKPRSFSVDEVTAPLLDSCYYCCSCVPIIYLVHLLLVWTQAQVDEMSATTGGICSKFEDLSNNEITSLTKALAGGAALTRVSVQTAFSMLVSKAERFWDMIDLSVVTSRRHTAPAIRFRSPLIIPYR